MPNAYVVCGSYLS